jgi:MFS family permease
VNELRSRFRESAAALAGVFANPGLRRIEFAYAGSSIGSYAYSITLAVYAFRHGGATAVGLVFAARMGLAALVAPFAAGIGDRYPRRLVLLASDLGRVGVMVLIAITVSSGGSSLLVYALAFALTTLGTVFRPTEAALIPLLARSPAELTAANVASSTFESVASFLGPAVAGGILALWGSVPAFAFVAGTFGWSALNVLRLPAEAGEPVGEEEQEDEAGDGFAGLAAGFVSVGREPRLRLLLGLVGAQCLVSGALGVLIVSTALDLLKIGTGGVGLLEAVCGVGSIAGAGAMLTLVGRGKLASDFGIGLVLWGLPLAVVGLAPVAAIAFVAWVVVGLGNTMVDIASITLVQRTAPADVIARVFGVLESVTVASFAAGFLIAPALIAVAGVRGALIAVGALLPVLAVLCWSRLRVIDEGARVPEERLAALRTVPFLAVLPLQRLEYLAARATEVELAAGASLFRQGDHGDRFYVLTSGAIAIELTDGDKVERAPAYVGEIALLRNVPRTASVRIVDDARFLALDRSDFLDAVVGQSRARAGAEAVVGARLHAATAG